MTPTEEVPFTDLLSSIVDNRGRTCPTVESGLPLIATNCIKPDRLYPAFEKVRYVSPETYRTWFRGHPEPGDIIFVCKGSPGRVALTPDPVTFCIAQDMVAVRPDPAKVYPRYLLAVLRWQGVQERIRNMHVGTLIPHFKKGDFGNLLLPVVSPDKQRWIGDLYFELSEKIEANRQLAEVADDLAKAHYDAASAENDWPTERLGSAATVVLGGTPKRDVAEYWENGTVAWLNSGKANEARIVTPSEWITEDALAKSAAKLMPSGTTLLAITGATLGQIARLELEASGNQSLVGIWSPNRALNDWLYFAVRSSIDRVLSTATGAAQQHINKGNVEDLEIDRPPDARLKEWARLTAPLLDRAAAAEREILRLQALREALLPALLTGGIEVPEVLEPVASVGEGA